MLVGCPDAAEVLLPRRPLAEDDAVGRRSDTTDESIGSRPPLPVANVGVGLAVTAEVWVPPMPDD